MTNIKLRKTTEQDIPLLMAWWDHPLVNRYFYVVDNHPLNNPLIYEWFREHIYNKKGWEHFIVEYEGRAVGEVNAQNIDSECPEVGYYIGETSLWGKHICRQGIVLLLDILRERGCVKAMALIHKDNIASIKMIEALNFKRKGEKDGEWHYERLL